MNMIRLTELVLEYSDDQLAAWKRGDKSIIPDWIDVTPEVHNQPHYHFGEYFVLRHFADRGWRGFVNYAIGEWEPDNPRYFEGRRKIEAMIDPARLARMRELRKGIPGGEPDVFLYREPDEIFFVEVKKEGDRVSAAQLNCLGQIEAILGAKIGIVYLKQRTKAYTPKTYEIDSNIPGC